MRKILFRGKNDRGEWIEGFYIKDYIGTYIYDKYRNTRMQSVLPETVGQFTGLTDKNGKEIFEGDIVKGAWDTIFQVVYDDCYLGFRAKEKDGMHNCIDYYGLDRIEIIGNVHDNPELLKGELI